MKRALLVNAVSPEIGGVLIRGEKGTAKSTAARALAALLPDITVVADCPYSCDPQDVAHLCAACAERAARGDTLPSLRRRVRICDLPVGATEDRVIGTLDLEQALQKGASHFEPGLLAQAHRGILYIDEVNLLSHHLVDVLLDAAAAGVNDAHEGPVHEVKVIAVHPVFHLQLPVPPIGVICTPAHHL